jgi:maleamate amidohydrolase
MIQNIFSHKALLIVDVQNDFTAANAKMPVDQNQAAIMISNLNGIISKSKELNLTVIYIGNEYSKFDVLNIFRNFAAVKGTEGTKMDARLTLVNDNYFSKNKGNAFSNSKLPTFLKQNNITEIYIAGLYAEACIYATTKGSIKQHFATTILSDCIATKSDSKRNKMMAKYEKVGAKIISSSEL